MKKHHLRLKFAILAIILIIPLSLYGDEKEKLKRPKKEKAIMDYIMSCEGTLTTEYILKEGVEIFKVKCSEEPPQYITI